jgi:hypothetical protein
MHTDYMTGQIHPESPVAGDSPAARIISDAEALLEASYGERWPSRGILHLGAGAVLRCTSHRMPGKPEGPEILLDISLDRAELHATAGSHVLFRAWLHREASAQVVHHSIEQVSTLTWMVEEFADGDWVGVLRQMADGVRLPLHKAGDSW